MRFYGRPDAVRLSLESIQSALCRFRIVLAVRSTRQPRKMDAGFCGAPLATRDKKDRVAAGRWLKEVAPSTVLRKWFVMTPPSGVNFVAVIVQSLSANHNTGILSWMPRAGRHYTGLQTFHVLTTANDSTRCGGSGNAVKING